MWGRNREGWWCDTRFTVHELEQQAKRIGIARNRLRTEASLCNEMVSEEALKMWSDKGGSGHGLAAPWLCCRSKSTAAVWSSSGVAGREQQMVFRPTCTRETHRRGSQSLAIFLSRMPPVM